MTRAVSIVIPSWNGLELLKRFLPTVLQASTHYTNEFGAPTEIVIVDDGSADESVGWLLGQGFVEVREGKGEVQSGEGAEGWRRSGAQESAGQGEGVSGEPFVSVGGLTSVDAYPDREASKDAARRTTLKLIRNESNRGFGETCNRGFETASHPLVFLLNNDVAVDLNSIAPLVENFKDDSIFAAHCRVFDLSSGEECGTGKLGGFARGFIRVHKSYVPRTSDKNESLDSPPEPGPLYSMFAGGGSAMFDRKKFLEIGGFEPLLSPFYWEDVELSYRAWKRGYAVLYEPRSIVRHRISSTIKNLDRHKVRRIEQRNRLIYHWIHLHQRSALTSHVVWLVLLALISPFRLRFSFVASLFAALKRLPVIGKRRRDERRAARRTDRDVFDIFAAVENRADVFAYDDYSELEALRSGKRN